MDFAINDREPTLTIIRNKMIVLNEKIVAYKEILNRRYNLGYNSNRFDRDTSNNKWVSGNNGSITCNKYCHGKNNQSWNNELPSNWLGAQCLAAGKNKQYGCNQINVYDINPDNYDELPVLSASDLSNPNSEDVPTIEPVGGQLNCLCQRNDTFPFSSAADGDNRMPPGGLYNFNTGGNTVHQMTCGNDLSVKQITTQCLKDLWSNAGCKKPLDITGNGPYTLPGTSNVFDISGNNIDMKKANINLGNLTTIIPSAISFSPTSCGAIQSLSEMRDDILSELNEINKLIHSTDSTVADNIKYKERNSPILLAQFIELKKTFDELQEDLKEPILLDGNYEMTSINVKSKYGNYVLFLLLGLFMIGSLIYIFKNPEVGNLDIFILVLAVIIFVYYIYEYIQVKKRN